MPPLKALAAGVAGRASSEHQRPAAGLGQCTSAGQLSVEGGNAGAGHKAPRRRARVNEEH